MPAELVPNLVCLAVNCDIFADFIIIIIMTIIIYLLLLLLLL